MCLDTTNSYRNFWRKNEGMINKRKEKNTVARRFGGWEGLCFSEEGGWGQINMENKTVEMVVKDLLLADNRKKRRSWRSESQSWSWNQFFSSLSWNFYLFLAVVMVEEWTLLSSCLLESDRLPAVPYSLRSGCWLAQCFLIFYFKTR